MATTPTLPGDFGEDVTVPRPFTHNVPDNLRRANVRLQFPPAYVVVGVYRLFTDKKLYGPAWKKCEHGAVRGLTIGLVWATTTFKMQRKFVEIFLINSPRVTGLSKESVFGFGVPFDLPTYATVMFLSSQITVILTWCLSHNLRIARERAYNQTIESRGKGSEFWQPYVEEWDVPPHVGGSGWGKFFGGGLGKIVVKIGLYPFDFVPLVGILVSAWLRALGTARYLHRPYFQAKGMTTTQVSVFIEERKWDYRAFGFAAALLERLPLVGLVFSISNRIGAAMWAHDLEKRQHYVAELKISKNGQVAPQ
ncbi:hypothetical protein BKA93DRAFT_785534 [Sparassis latifolia]|uniref:Uncharacterized protein n=1 Tax=Sparassis crispa TaxID=139825 RepID=A0A401G4Y5_9APHY|nr:hypothetical protein SCP_0100810 [Sparassis crispa]GBE77209.1 hypothetical protein SCP_0100810 [Sparassis crispa]